MKLIIYKNVFNVNNSTVQYLHNNNVLKGIQPRRKQQQLGSTLSIKGVIKFKNNNHPRCHTQKTSSFTLAMNIHINFHTLIFVTKYIYSIKKYDGKHNTGISIRLSMMITSNVRNFPLTFLLQYRKMLAFQTYSIRDS